MEVRCPRCDAVTVLTPRSADAASQATFFHQDDACPVLLPIQAALARMEAALAAETN